MERRREEGLSRGKSQMRRQEKTRETRMVTLMPPTRPFAVGRGTELSVVRLQLTSPLLPAVLPAAALLPEVLPAVALLPAVLLAVLLAAALLAALLLATLLLLLLPV